MKDTKLILIEGISGSGKSTLAQFLTRAFTNQGIPCQWWYEEEKRHPLYIFNDQQSLQNVVEALSSGRYQQIIESVLEQWQIFSQEAQSSEKVIIIDGSLFGYLTWSLFPLDIPNAEALDLLGFRVYTPSLGAAGAKSMDDPFEDTETNKKKTVLEPSLLEPFVGTYTFLEEGERRACLVMLENGSLIVDNMPQVWPRTRLIPQANNIFLVESLPFQVAFEKDVQGTIIGMRASGPALLFGSVDCFFTR